MQTICMSSAEPVSPKRTSKVGPGRFIPLCRKNKKYTRGGSNKEDQRPQLIVFYSYKASTHRSGSDTTEGIHNIENKKNPMSMRTKQRSNLQNQDPIWKNQDPI